MAKYNSIENIPAKLFFDILQSKDYTKLEASEVGEDLEKVFADIYDDFFVKTDNQEANHYLKQTLDVAFLEYKIATIKQYLHFVYSTKLTEEHRLKLLKSIKEGLEIYIDVEANFDNEVQRVLQVECGIIENDLTMAKLEIENISKKRTEVLFDFYDNIVSLSNVHNRNIEDTIVLAYYISIEKSANRIIKQQK